MRSTPLYIAFEKLVQLVEQKQHDPEQWQKAKTEYNQILHVTSNSEAILHVLNADTEDNLPIAEKTNSFEKILQLGPRTATILRKYADHLWFHGPQDDALVEALKKEAEQLEKSAN